MDIVAGKIPMIINTRFQSNGSGMPDHRLLFSVDVLISCPCGGCKNSEKVSVLSNYYLKYFQNKNSLYEMGVL